MVHRGKIIENIVRKSGYNLTKLADKLGVSRNTLYNRFKDPELSYHFILEVGRLIHYDFTPDFPEMKQQPDLAGIVGILGREDKSADLWRLENKYTRLLEKYTRLLEMITRVAFENELYPLSPEIQKLIEEGSNTDTPKQAISH